VKLMAPSSLRRMISKATAGVGVKVRKQRSNSVVLQDVYGELGKLLGVETRVVTHEDAGSFALDFHVFGDSRHGQTHVGEGKSSAMSPRHPEVPNLIGEVVMGRYSRPERVESRKLKAQS